jgi:hypothetical protein
MRRIPEKRLSKISLFFMSPILREKKEFFNLDLKSERDLLE